jgi:hypothetical protein
LGRYQSFERYNPFSGNYGCGQKSVRVHQDRGPTSQIPVWRVMDAVRVVLDQER